MKPFAYLHVSRPRMIAAWLLLGMPAAACVAQTPDQIAFVRNTSPYLTWFVDSTGDRVPDRTFEYAVAGDRPVVGDLDGDGVDDIAITRHYEGWLVWHCDTDGNGSTDLIFAYGVEGDRAVAGDIDGDGVDDIAITRDYNGMLVWHCDLTRNGSTDLIFAYGEAGDQAVIGDFNGDGVDDIAITRDFEGVLAWHVDLTRNGSTDLIFAYGEAGDMGVAGNINAARPPPASLYMVVDLSDGPAAASYAVSYLNAVPVGGWTDEYKTTKLVMRRIPAGTFTMGSPTNELGRVAEREAQRQVTLTKDFYIGVFEVTQKQWERVMGDWPSWFTNAAHRETRPLESRSWNDIRGGTWPDGQPGADTFMQRIGERTALAFDLPTEAQWEYACRAGTTTALNSGKNLTSSESACPNMAEVGRYVENSSGMGAGSDGDTSEGTAKVGSYLPNEWGLFDMHGNVWEWCLDWFVTAPSGTVDPAGAASGLDRVVRGGSWHIYARFCRSAVRGSSRPDSQLYGFGFRPSLTLP